VLGLRIEKQDKTTFLKLQFSVVMFWLSLYNHGLSYHALARVSNRAARGKMILGIEMFVYRRSLTPLYLPRLNDAICDKTI
jgi:hypothetical protein